MIFVVYDELAGDYKRRAPRTICITCEFFFSAFASTNFGYIFGNISKTRNMVKRPRLGKRKRVTLPQMESSDQPEQPEQAEQPDELPDTQASDPGDPATQGTQPEDTEESEEPTHGRYKKKRLVRMTDAQEDEMAQLLKNHPEMYNKGKKECRDMDRKEAAWATQARAMGMEGEFIYAITLSIFLLIM